MKKILPAISPIVRLSAGLTMLTLSMLLVLDFFGFMPNESAIKQESRRTVAEILAVQVSSEVGRGQLDLVDEAFKRLQNRNDDVNSVAIRLSNGRILTSAGAHTQHWSANPNGRSTATQIEVPIYNGGVLWGKLELSFEPPINSLMAFLRSGSFNATLLLVAALGFVVFWFFLKRALRELDPRSVIPERVNSAMNVLAEGLVMLDNQGRIVMANRVFEQMSGRAQQTLVGSRLMAMAWTDPATGGEKPPAEYPWESVLKHESATGRAQLVLQSANEKTYSLAVNTAAITAGDGSVKGVVVTFDDVTELERQNTSMARLISELKTSQLEIEQKNKELELLATRDPLTGVFNRRSLLEGMDAVLTESAEQQTPVSCIMCDIDHFKSINDRFGHGVGDDVIKMMADILTEGAPASSIVARYGGEEFVVALPETTEAQAQSIAEQMRVALASARFATEGGMEKTSASFGVSCNADIQVTTKELIDNADQALYRAKETGRNRVFRFSQLTSEELTETPNVQTEESDTVQEVDTEQESVAIADAPVKADTSPPEVPTVESSVPTVERSKAHSFALSAYSNLIGIEQLTQAIAGGKDSETNLAVLSVHVDALEIVGNTFGTGEADNAFDTIEAQLRSLLLSSDATASSALESDQIAIYRVGMAEMLILISGLSNDKDLTWIVKTFESTRLAPLEITDWTYSVDMRTGISVFPWDGDDAQRLLSTSRLALRDARSREALNGCLFYDKEMRVRTEEKLRLESELQHAIERDELFLVYQPCVDIRTGTLEGFETLVRWQNPRFGLVAPERLIALAEDTHLINPIGRWIFDSAMLQLKAWREQGYEAINLAVNVSAKQLEQEDFLSFLLGTLAEYQIPANSVTIELTESTLIKDGDAAARFTEALRLAGLTVALDDFGTGYSSLQYLRQMPVDILKIDRTFFHDFPNNPQDKTIISSVIALSESLGLTVVAEGVETPAQLKAITQMRCDSVQGYVFSAPLSGEHATTLLADNLEQRRMLRPLSKLPKMPPGPDVRATQGLINELSENDVQSLSKIKLANGV